MAPSITPSPHRFLSSSSSRQAKSVEQQSATGTSNSPGANLSKSFSTRATQSPGTPFNRGAPRFISKPRFAGPGSPVSEHPQNLSPRVKRDRVEEFDHSPPGLVKQDGPYSPIVASVKQHRGGERIDESTDDGDDDDDDDGDDAEYPRTSSVMHDDEEDYFLAPFARKRKLPARVPWPGPVLEEQRLPKKNYQVSLSNNTTRSAASPAQANQDVSANILYPSGQTEATRDKISPRPSSVVSPQREGHNRPRFEFAKLTERSSNKLQKITGTGHFILDSTANGADTHREPLSSENTNLTLLFSPQKHKKYQYAPGGLASTVRDWVLDAAVGIGSATYLSTIRIISVDLGERGSRMVCGVNQLQEKERILLLGEPRGSRIAVVVKGCHIVIMEPSWTLESDGALTVAMNWKIV